VGALQSCFLVLSIHRRQIHSTRSFTLKFNASLSAPLITSRPTSRKVSSKTFSIGIATYVRQFPARMVKDFVANNSFHHLRSNNRGFGFRLFASGQMLRRLRGRWKARLPCKVGLIAGSGVQSLISQMLEDEPPSERRVIHDESVEHPILDRLAKAPPPGCARWNGRLVAGAMYGVWIALLGIQKKQAEFSCSAKVTPPASLIA
jgi:hypothetical protein